MKTLEFYKKRNVIVSNEQGTFEFNSFADVVGFFNDVKNTEQWAKAHKGDVFVCDKSNTIGKIVETFETVAEAENYANELNEFFAVREEYYVAIVK